MTPTLGSQSITVEGFPLSPQQDHLWSLQPDGQVSPYRVHCVVRIDGNLDCGILTKALSAVWEKHEILRTSIRNMPGAAAPLQIILDGVESSASDPRTIEHSISPSTEGSIGRAQTLGGPPLIDAHDLIGYSPTNQEIRIDELCREANRLPFDFASGRLSHISLITLSSTRHALLINQSALCADSASLRILVREIALAYSACSRAVFCHHFSNDDGPEQQSGSATATDGTVQYADLAAWQNTIVESDDAKPGRDYWRKQHLDFASLKLRDEGSGKANRQFNPLFTASTISPDDFLKIETIAEHYNVSSITFLLACWQILLWRLNKDSNPIVGIACDARDYPGLRETLGPLAKYLPISFDLSEPLRLPDLLQQVSEAVRKAVEWQEYFTWSHIQQFGDEHPAGSSENASVSFISSLFEYQDEPITYSATNLRLSICRQYSCTDRFKLKLKCVRKEDTVVAEFHYDSDLFCDEDIKRLGEQFHTLLASAISCTKAAIGDLQILNQRQRDQLVGEFNATGPRSTAHQPRRVEQFLQPKEGGKAPRTALDLTPADDLSRGLPLPKEEASLSSFIQSSINKCVHEAFEDQAQRTPDMVALVFGRQRLTYAQLETRVNQLARHLRSLGVRPGVLVAVAMERSVEMIVALIGILKAGGCYVPIDPLGPRERQTFMLEDTAASVLITQSYLAKKLPCAGAEVLCLDSEWETIAHNDSTILPNISTLEDAAYVIYTSGSTGQPKGVIVEHGGLMNAVNWIVETLDLSPQDSSFLKTPITFDAAGRELFPVLVAGGTLFIAEPGREGDSEYLAEMMRDEGISTLHCVPSMLRLLVEEAAFDHTLRLRAVMCGGEPLSAPLVLRFQSRSAAKLYNVYGPTEASIDTAFWLCERIKDDSPILIGKPIPNSQIYILDDSLHLVPIGVAGGLHIGGVGLARGYLNRPALTAEKFVPNPFGQEPGTRLYQTGDIGRHLPDGNIEFIGRSDHQVKIRGYRIELGEIESALLQHPAVREAVVVAHQDAPGDTRLVAYLVSEREVSPTAGELRHFLHEKLPEYMVPAVFVTLAALPLLNNGKVDRRRLPASQRSRTDFNKSYVAPRAVTEELLAEIWAQVLGIERIGIYDDFFELGGHSLLATQAVSRIREAFQVELPLRRLFELPTIAGLAPNIELTKRTGKGITSPPILPVSRDGVLPLSFAQQRLWFIDQLDPQSSVYNFPAALRLIGPLNLDALKSSLAAIVKRHEILRTTFASVDGQPIQIIASTLPVALAQVDLRTLPETEREIEMKRLAVEEARRPFDLACGPLLRVTLLRLDEEEYVGLLTMHHIISDGWSIGILIREMAIFYEAFSSGKPTSLPELPIQYADFAAWQRHWLQGEVLDVQLSYWKRKLYGAPPLLDLGTDHTRPSSQTFKGAHQTFVLPKGLSDKLKALGRQEEATLFMVLVATFNLLLHRHTGKDDFVVGTPIANRDRLETEGLIGFFANTLVLRTNLAGNPTFRELVRRVRETCLDAYVYQDLPFERLVEELNLERDLSRNPLFQAMFVLRNAPNESVRLPGLTLSPVEVDSGTAHFDLILHMADAPDGLTGTWTYNTDIFEPPTITRMLEHFEILLGGAVADPEQRLSDLPLLKAAEQHRLLNEWNTANIGGASDLGVHQLFEVQAERTPDAVAIVFGDEEINYGELNRRANRLAHHLRRLGIESEKPVGIYLDLSPNMIVGVLAVLKAGGAFVPLDPAYPRTRTSFMLDDTQLSVVLTDERLAEDLADLQAHVICLGSGCEVVGAESEENPISSACRETLAYVIYTSGSTGKPKGVLVSHGSLADHCREIQALFELDSNDRILHSASLSFDLSLEQILPTLLVGARLVMQGLNTLATADFYRMTSQHELTVLNLPTAYWQDLAREWANSPDCLASGHARLFIVGGDTMASTALDLWRQTAFGSVRLFNAYGPTETTITATTFEIEACGLHAKANLASVPIGRPLIGRQAYILDRFNNLAPIGVPGELHLGGAGLARGYLNHADLTAERFIPNPFSLEPGARLYKTGDRARYLADGNIEFLGRCDDQIKIRGYRIEPKEIELAISQYPGIYSAVVIAQEEVSGDKRLIGYFVAEHEHSPTANELRVFLREKLPEFMIPAVFVTLAAMPLTAGGKVDRRALPAPDRTRTDLERTYIAPRDALELQLTQLWEEVLGVQLIGVRDNFFELGGHSLAAVRLFALIERRLGRKLPLATVFQGATIEHLATILRQGAQHARQSSLVAIQPIGTMRPLFLIHPAGGHVFPYVQLAHCLGQNQPCYGLQAKGLEEGQLPQTRIEDMAAYYIEALRSLQAEGPYCIGGWSAGGVVAFEMAQQLAAQGHRVALLALLDARIPTAEEDFADEDFEATLLADFIRYFGLSLGSRESLARLPKDELITRVLEQAKLAGLIPLDVDASQAHPFIELCKADFRATRNYVPRPYPGRITLFRAGQELTEMSSDPTLGWSKWAAEGVDVHVVPGNHASMVYKPHVEVLAQKLSSCLHQVRLIECQTTDGGEPTNDRSPKELP